MKSLIYKTAIAAALSAALLIACSKKTDIPGATGEFAVANAHHSGCNYHTDAKGWQNPDSASFSYANGTLHVTHYNLLVNCGSAMPESIIYVRANIDGNAIEVWEEEDENAPQANCMCEVDNEFDITGLSHGTYTLTFHSWYPQTQTLTFSF